MNDRAQKITKHTLVPVGMVIAAACAAWAVASDRQQALGRIEINKSLIDDMAVQIDDMAAQIDYLARGMIRIEIKLDTLPEGEVIP